MIPVAEYTNSADPRAEMLRAHAERQARIFGQAKKVNIAKSMLERENDNLRKALEEATSTIETMSHDVEEMRHQVSEYQRSAVEYMRQMEEMVGELSCNIGERRTVKDIVVGELRNFPGITMADVLSARRGRALIAARHACIAAVIHERPDLSYPRIGKFFGRDHTTILHVERKFRSRRKSTQDTRQ